MNKKLTTLCVALSLLLTGACVCGAKPAALPGHWYMGTMMGQDCNLHLLANHHMVARYGGCFHQDPPLSAMWRREGDKVFIEKSAALRQVLGAYLKISHRGRNDILIPETHLSEVQKRGAFPRLCFWRNLLKNRGMELPEAARRLAKTEYYH